MSRIYTDKELMIATQLAYCNWDNVLSGFQMEQYGIMIIWADTECK